MIEHYQLLKYYKTITHKNKGLGFDMGYSFGGPIVTNGLVASWDAADKNSYPGSGTTWSDLVNSNDGTLTNGPVHNADGYMTFDGTNDHAVVSNLDASDFQGGFTFSCWVRFHAISGNNIIFGRHINNDRMYMGINGSNVKIGIGDNYVTSGAHGMSADTWYNVCITREGTTNKYFVDLVEKKSLTTNWSGTDSTAVHIASMNNSGDSQHLDGDIALIHLYNRALTTLERTQNFNAQRDRFGV